MITQEEKQKPTEQEEQLAETQGKTEKDNISQDKQQTQSIQLLSPKAGTATSSPRKLNYPPTNKVFAASFNMSKHSETVNYQLRQQIKQQGETLRLANIT